MQPRFSLKKLFVLSSLLFTEIAMGQTTGSFDVNITFQSQPRQLSFYVPTNYNPANSYRLMVCLHGLGDNSANYRNGLINSLGWGTNMPNTIFVCPEAANINNDYFDPAGGEAIIQSSIDYSALNYNIDTTDIVLQGFSLGGRAALRYGLDHYNKFKGLLLNTPAVQGVKEAINGSSNYPFNYTNASQIPIYMTLGNTDDAYISPLDSAYEQMVLADGIVKFVKFAGGHVIQPTAQLLSFNSFFNNPSNPGHDLDVVKINAPLRSCALQIPGTNCLVRNTGTDTIHTLNLDYTINGNTLSHTWNGLLAPFQHALVTLPTLNAGVGNQTLQATVTTLETTITDTFAYNNSRTVTITVQTQGTTLPFIEGFESSVFPPANWVLGRAGDFYSYWDWDNTVSKTGSASMYAFNTIFYFDNSERKEDVSTPLLDLTSTASPFLRFDVSYNYHRYQPPVVTSLVDFADTLEVLISTDCGNSQTSLFKKGGANLATFFQPIINPLSIPALFIYPADSNWRSQQIDLSNFASADKAIITFRYVSALGGSINIDNVMVAGPLSVLVAAAQNDLKIYPNPASDIINISSGQAPERVEVLDVSGKKVQTLNNDGKVKELSLNISSLPEGLYVLKVYTENGVTSSKVMIKR